jgi:sigma-B regulation protein RsbU (phosphoserine phosphatase)
MDEVAKRQWLDAVAQLLNRAHLVQADEIGDLVADVLRPLQVEPIVYLVDHEQRMLRTLPADRKPAEDPLPVDGSLPGRVFATVRSRASSDGAGSARLWTPMVNGTERLGVIAFTLPDRFGVNDPDVWQNCELVAGTMGHLVTSKLPYGDALRRLRRSRPMSVAAELVWQMLPPSTFSSERMAISAILEPCYDVGGDGFDYALDGSVAHLLILDAAGHDLRAGLVCAVAISTVRAARRAGRGLQEQATEADTALLEQFPDARFATAVLAELDLDTGSLRYINAGHPAPLLLRNGRLVRSLDGGRRLPLGLGYPSTEAGQERLQPGDRLLLYTDGITEAGAAVGEPFGTARLVELAEHHLANQQATPETLRRLCHAVIEHQHGLPADDATLLLLDWSATSAKRNVPGLTTI